MHRRVLQRELKPFQIQVQTINPKAFLTGFNETMCESALHWQDDSRNFIKRADIQNYFAFFGEEDERHDPKEMIEAMVSIVPADTGFPQCCAQGIRGVHKDRPKGSLGKQYLKKDAR